MGSDDTIVGPDSGPRASGTGESPGEVIGPYTLVKMLGEGGFGSVWLAERTLPYVQSVALKIIKPGMDSRAVVARFEQERQALALMNHPHVAKVLDGGLSQSGRPYFAMEFVQGMPISEFCDSKGLPLRARLELFLQVCDAIQHAHTKGLIHRDLKPANVLVAEIEGEGPSAKVIDFGIAKALTQQGPGQEQVTEAGVMIGTPEYMSPEQAEGDAQRIDTRTDVYSLGVILYELLTGTLPFEPTELRSKTYLEMQRTIREDDPPPPSARLTTIATRDRDRASRIEVARGLAMAALARDLKRELEWIPLKAMRKEPEERYQSAIALAEDVRNYLGGRPLVAAPESAAYRIRKYVRRNRALVSGAAAVLLALVTGLGLATWQWRVAVREKLAAEEARRRVEAAAYIANVQMADSWREARKTDRLQERLAECVPSRRDWEWGWLSANADASIASLRGHAGEVLAARFLPDSRAITTSYDGSVRVWDIAREATIHTLAGHAGPVLALATTPDGKTTVTGSADSTARVWDVSGGRETARLEGHTGAVNAVAVSTDGARAVTGSEDGTAALWDCATGKRICTLAGHTQPIDAVAIDAGSALCITGSRDGAVRVFDCATGAPRATLAGHEGPVLALRFSGDGSTLLSGGADGTVRAWSVATGTAGPVMRGHSGAVYSVRWSDGGTRALSASADGTARIWDPRAGTCVSVLEGHDGEVISCDFSPDGRRAVTGGADGTVRVWDIITGIPLAELAGHTGIVFSSSFSADGSRILSGSQDGTARVWDPATSPALTDASGSRSVIVSVLPDARGERVLIIAADALPRVHDARTGAAVAELHGHTARVLGGDLTADGTRAVTASADGTTRLWDARSGQEVGRIGPDDLGARTARFSPDGSRIATAGKDGTAHIWSASSRELLRTLDGHSNRISSIMFSRDGSRLLTASQDQTARIWDASTGAVLHSLSAGGTQISSAAFSPDATVVLTSHADGTAALWSAADGRLIGRLEGHTKPIMSFAFTPDGSRVVTASRDGTARIWDAASGRQVVNLAGHGGIVPSVAVHPSGRRVATACFDKVARVWDIESGAQLVALPAHEEAVTAVAFSPNGARLFTGDGNGNARLWDGAPPKDRPAYLGAVARGPSESQELTGPARTRLIRRALDRKQFAEAIEAARVWGIDGADPLALNSLAWNGTTALAAGDRRRDLDLLLECATRAVRETRRANPAYMDTLARVHWERGEREAAIATEREAIAVLDAQPVPSDADRKAQRDKLRADMAATLAAYSEPSDAPKP